MIKSEKIAFDTIVS